MDILIVLLEDPGQVVTREKIRQRVWEDAFVEEANITKNIGLLRSTLRMHLDDSDPIRTIPKRGYQFVGPVDESPGVGSFGSGSGTRKALAATDIEGGPEVEAEAPQATPVAPSRWVPMRRVGWIAASVVLLAACTGFGLDRWRNGRPVQASGRQSLAILTLKNLSDDASENWLGAALDETLNADLTAGDGVRLVSSERVDQAERDLTIENARTYDNKTIQAVGRRLACDLTLTGWYLPEGDQIRLDLQLRRTGTGAVVTTFSRVVDRAQMTGTMAEASALMRKAIGLAAAAPVDRYLQGVEHEGQGGVRNYLEGRRLMAAGRFNEARPLLSAAVQVKPDFALAHSALASTLLALGYADQAKEEAKLAVSNAGGLEPDKRLALEANAYAIFTDWPKAIAAYNKLWKMHPDDLDWPAALAECLYRSGSPKQALSMLQGLMASSKVAANDPRFALLEASATHEMADWRLQLVSAGDTIRLARANSSPYFEARGFWLEGMAWARVGDTDHGLADLREAQQISQRIGDELGLANVLTSLGSEQGYRKDPEALVTLRRALGLYEKLGNRAAEVSAWSELGCALTYTEDWTAAKAAFHAAIDRAAELHNPVLAFGAVLDLSYVASNQDDLEAELEHAQEALKLSRAAGNIDGVGSSLGYLGDVEYAKGNLAAAREWYEQALTAMRQMNSGYAIAKLLNHMALVDIAAGDLESARRREDEAAGLHVLAGERLEQQMLIEAKLKMEEGHPEAVAAPMTELANKYTTAQPAAEAWRLLAASRLAQGDVAGARVAVDKALALAKKSEDTTDFLIPSMLLGARVDAAEGHGAKAVATLNALLERARKIKSERLQLEIRLAMGTIAVQNGRRSEGEQALKTVAAEAQAKGFGLTAGKARKVLAGTVSAETVLAGTKG